MLIVLVGENIDLPHPMYVNKVIDFTKFIDEGDECLESFDSAHWFDMDEAEFLGSNVVVKNVPYSCVEQFQEHYDTCWIWHIGDSSAKEEPHNDLVGSSGGKKIRRMIGSPRDISRRVTNMIYQNGGDSEW